MSKLILGYFGYKDNQIDGQTIKTRNVYNLFKKEFNNVIFFDTQDLKYNKISYIILFYKILLADEIILLPGKNNLKKLLPILIKFKKIRNTNIYLFAVGGWLAEFINKENINLYRKIDYFFVESLRLKRDLENIGINNITVFPNFRIHNFSTDYISIKDDKTLKIIFVARITPEKGCNYILDFAEYYKTNHNLFSKDIIIDFYGPLDIEYETTFINRINKYDFVNYKGYIDSNIIHDVISKYDINILPTYYEGEGFPGTIIDSYIAGIPMIISRWKDLPEFVENEKTGFILNTNSIDELISIIKKIENNKTLAFLKNNSLEKSREYSYKTALNIIKSKIK